MKHLRVSVRALVEHSLRSGSLDHQLSDSIHPVEAIRIHQKIQNSRPDGYLKEVHVSHHLETDDFVLEVRGRIDGVLEKAPGTLIEEIKTVRAKPPENNQLHWGQAMVYSYIYAADHNLDNIDTQLTYFLLKTGQIQEFVRQHNMEELTEFFQGLTARFLEWQTCLATWSQMRNKSIEESSFPFPSYRPGQREMAVAVYRTIKDSNQLLVQAPTGIGKTMSALFPAIKAISEGLTRRVFYLTARTTGKQAAEKALIQLAEAGVQLKSLTLTAKQKTCFNPEKECNGEDCSYARGFYDRLAEAVTDLFQQDLITRDVLEEYARKHHICPFEFSLELSRWVDCVICDYNYVFDPRVHLRRVFQDTIRQHVFVVDEAHNLPDRAREMFSAQLEKQGFLELKRTFSGFRQLSSILGKINLHLGRLRRQHCAERRSVAEEEPPSELYPGLKEFHQIAEDVLLSEGSQELPERESLLDLYFQVGSFLRVADQYDGNYVTCYESRGRDLRIKLFCLDPADLLKEILKESQASVYFSATLTPLDYFRTILGCSDEANRFHLPSPFPLQNLSLVVASQTSTIFRKRNETRHEVASLLNNFVSQRAGNYLLFFPSYQYMSLILDCFPTLDPPYETVTQTPSMTEQERSQFVARFGNETSERLVGFAVMGGVFGEGIDLVGERLAGAAIVGVGLPAISLERDSIRRLYNRRGLPGFDYAYRFPGINRVLQAAGRVIRSETDRGAILLIDSRYSLHSYRLLLPNEWEPVNVENEFELAAQLQTFWTDDAVQTRP